MLDKDTQGLWCRADGKWYYLEAGVHSNSYGLDRVKRVLIARGLVSFKIEGITRNEEPYKVLLWRDAEEKGYEPVPIYLNAHVKKTLTETETTKVSSPWDL